MRDLWVIDVKCTVSPESSLPQDGSEFYYARCAVPAPSESEAIALLTDHLAEDQIKLVELILIRSSDAEDWSEDDDYEVLDSIDQAQASNSIATGCFISERTL